MAEAAAWANTFLIGAQKSGTTYLAALLGQSPEVCVCTPKEPHFFSLYYEGGLDAYARTFADPHAPIRLDASTTYSFLRPARALGRPQAPGIDAPVPQRIAEAAPEAKLIYILRDPVDRAMSAYKHNMRKELSPKAPVSLVAALEHDPMLVLVGRYADQIERYLEVFTPDRFLFLDFAELTRDPAAVLARTCAFLGISPVGLGTETSNRARHSALRLSGLGRALAMNPLARGLARAVLPLDLRGALVHRFLTQPAEIEFSDIEAADAYFVEDQARTKRLTGLAL